MPKIHYAFKELDVPTMTTVSTWISFVQFALLPLQKAEIYKPGSGQNKSNFSEKLEIFNGTFKFLLAPLDLISQFQRINPPMRVLLFATIIFGTLNILAYGFYYPAVHLILFACDLFMPAFFFFGISILTSKYKDIKSTAIILLVIGLIYLIARIAFYFFILLRKRDRKWEVGVSREITNVFYARITHSSSDHEIQSHIDAIEARIFQMDEGSPFRFKHAKQIDFLFSFLLFIAEIIIIFFVGWKKIFSKSFHGKQLEHVDLCLKIISIMFFVATLLRVIFSFFYVIKFEKEKLDKIANLILKTKRIFFKLLILVSGLCLMPVLNMVLSCTSTENLNCTYNAYYDFQHNTSTFLDYFRERPDYGCHNCTKYSHEVNGCSEYCFYGEALQYVVVKEAPYLDGNTVNTVYMIPIALLEVYFLAFFLQLQRVIFTTAIDVLENFPSPTTRIETKWQSLLALFNAAPIGTFKSYTYEHSLYMLSFNQGKLFALFAISLLPIFPTTVIKNASELIVPWIFVIVSLVISFITGLLRPYRSKLHNITTTVSYLIGGITSILSGLAICGINFSATIGLICFIFIVATTPVLTIILPFFLQVPKHKQIIQYHLKNIKNAEKKVRKRRIMKKNKKTYVSSDSSSEKSDENEDAEYEYTLFSLRQFAPIHIERGLQSRKAGLDDFKKSAREIWCKKDISNKDFQQAIEEMVSMGDKLIDASALNGLVRLLNWSTMFSSAMLGWAFGAGIAEWKVGKYLRCDKPNRTVKVWPIRSDV